MSMSMSFAGRRMMAAAARRAFHSQPPSVTIKEEPQVLSSLDAVAKANNLSRVPRQLNPLMREDIALDIEHKSRRIRINANPSNRSFVGDIWFSVWTNNLAAVFLLSAWFGVFEVRAQENQQSDHMSSLSPPSQ